MVGNIFEKSIFDFFFSAICEVFTKLMRASIISNAVEIFTGTGEVQLSVTRRNCWQIEPKGISSVSSMSSLDELFFSSLPSPLSLFLTKSPNLSRLFFSLRRWPVFKAL